MLACVMLLGMTVTLAENPRAAEIDQILKAQTDTSLISSPLLAPIQKGLESVVSVVIFEGEPTGKTYTEMDEITGGGSGTVVSPWGHVLTNAHVARDAQYFAIYRDGKFTTAYLVEEDKDEDLAILFAPGLRLPHAEFGDSDKLQVGEWAMCSPAAFYRRGRWGF